MSMQVMPEVKPESKLLHMLRKNLRAGWMRTFPQKSTRERAIDLVITLLVVKTRHTIAAAAVYNGTHQDKNWTQPYRIFSRSPWSERELFYPCLEKALSMLPDDSPWCFLSIDDTKVYKTGKKLPDTSIQRDSMSPPFHPNLRLAQRFVHAAITLPLYNQSPQIRARAIPVRFMLSPVVKKPGKRASPQAKAEWKEQKKVSNLSTHAATMVGQTRQDMDRAGWPRKRLVAVGDAGSCNRTMFRAVGAIGNTFLLARTRKDAKLARPAPQGSRKVYGERKFTPEQVRKDNRRPWKTTQAAYAGRISQIEFKRVDNVLWQRGAGRTPLTLFVLRPLPYKPSPNGPSYYRNPAYLLTDATDIPSNLAIQAYLDRWQIEVAHRDFKQDIGVGQAQVRNRNSVPRLPAAIVAAYSMMHLSALEVYGPTRNNQYPPLPAWRQRQTRPSSRDIIDLLATQLQQHTAATDYRPPVKRTRPPTRYRNSGHPHAKMPNSTNNNCQQLHH